MGVSVGVGLGVDIGAGVGVGVLNFSFGLFRNAHLFVSVRFETIPKHRNKPKQTEKNIFLFREKNRNRTETDRVSVCFGSNRKKNLFVSRTPYLSPWWIIDSSCLQE